MARIARNLLVLTLALGVTACGKSRETESKADAYDENDGISIANLIGTSKNPPDEFAVMTTAPLEMPQSFAALPPPNPGQRSRLTPDPVAEARSVLLGDVAPQAANARTSVSESALVAASGAQPPSDIRSVLEVEQAAADTAGQEYLLEDLFPSLRNTREADLANTIRPEAERVRLSTLTPASPASGAGVGSIPSAPAATISQPVATISAAPSPALPAVDAGTGAELIYIPE